jgi:hypothetical protein
MMVRRRRLFGGERCLMEGSINAVATSMQAITSVARMRVKSDTSKRERVRSGRKSAAPAAEAPERWPSTVRVANDLRQLCPLRATARTPLGICDTVAVAVTVAVAFPSKV